MLLAAVKPNEKRTLKLVRQLYKTDQVLIRQELLHLVVRVKWTDAETRQLLLDSLAHQQSKVRTAAAYAILKLELADQLLDGPIHRRLQSKDAKTLIQTARRIEALAKSTKAVDRELSRLRSDKNETVRFRALAASIACHGRQKRFAASLARFIGNSSQRAIRLEAIQLLGRFDGNHAVAAIPALGKAINSDDATVSEAAFDLLVQLQKAKLRMRK